MSYLLDTHVLLWLRLEPSKLSSTHRKVLTSSDGPKFISTITVWEISLKFAIGKLKLGKHTPEQFLESALELGLQILPPSPEQFASFHRLPPVPGHKDPFDRMLIWQAAQSNHILLSHDHKLPRYKIHGLQLI